MDVRIKSIDSLSVGRGYGIEADIEFEDDEQVIKDFGAERCAKALDETELYAALGGWENAKKFYEDEIEELLAAVAVPPNGAQS